MAITITERVESRASGKSSATLSYVIDGTGDDAAARSTIKAGSPQLFAGLTRNDYGVTPVGDPTISLKWDAFATYGPYNSSATAGVEDVGDFTESFDTGGGTTHITQSLGTTAAVALSGTAPDYDEAINVSRNGENLTVGGTDIVTPVYNFSETHVFDDSTVTIAYRAIIAGLTGKVANASFKGTDKGECLFLGASGNRRGEDEWELTFNFSAIPNKTGIEIGSIVTKVDKEGWQYLWVEYSDDKDPVSKTFIKKPTAAYVETVYEYGDFSTLGIGV